MNTLRIIKNVSAGTVAGIAAWSSYWHMVEVALRAGELAGVAYIMPASVDGMLVVSSIAMVDAKAGGRHPHWSVRLAFALGCAASVAANLVASDPTVVAKAVAAWAPVALLLVVEMLTRTGKRFGQPVRTAAKPRSRVTVAGKVRTAFKAHTDEGIVPDWSMIRNVVPPTAVKAARAEYRKLVAATTR